MSAREACGREADMSGSGKSGMDSARTRMTMVLSSCFIYDDD